MSAHQPPVAVRARDLCVRFNGFSVLRGVNLTVLRGRSVAVVGESGAGKSTLARALSALLPAPAQVRGVVRVTGNALVNAGDWSDYGRVDDASLRSVRGSVVGWVPQDPTASLSRYRRVGAQVADAARAHQPMSRSRAWNCAVQALVDVGMTDAEHRARQYPHELSGGMRHRVALARALVTQPQVLIADEPTASLDALARAQVLNTLSELQEQRGLTVVVLTHNLRSVASWADELVVLYAGQVVEQGPAAQVLGDPAMPYTQALVRIAGSVATNTTGRLPVIAGEPPDIRELSAGCAFAPRCGGARSECRRQQISLEPYGHADDAARWVRCIRAETATAAVTRPEPGSGSVPDPPGSGSGASAAKSVPVLRVRHLSARGLGRSGRNVNNGELEQLTLTDISLTLVAGRTLAIVGPNGSGKSTLAAVVAGLIPPLAGQVILAAPQASDVDEPTPPRWSWVSRIASRSAAQARQRRAAQVGLIFQDAPGSLNPNRRIGDSMAAPLAVQRRWSRAERREQVLDLARRVGLASDVLDRYPHQISGGQAQRAVVARAIAVRPRLLIADEPFSALDVSMQGQLLNLLHDLQREDGMALLLIAHDLGLVAAVADDIAVLDDGHLVDQGPAAGMQQWGQSPVTESLLAAAGLTR